MTIRSIEKLIQTQHPFFGTTLVNFEPTDITIQNPRSHPELGVAPDKPFLLERFSELFKKVAPEYVGAGCELDDVWGNKIEGKCGILKFLFKNREGERNSIKTLEAKFFKEDVKLETQQGYSGFIALHPQQVTSHDFGIRWRTPYNHCFGFSEDQRDFQSRIYCMLITGDVWFKREMLSKDPRDDDPIAGEISGRDLWHIYGAVLNKAVGSTRVHGHSLEVDSNYGAKLLHVYNPTPERIARAVSLVDSVQEYIMEYKRFIVNAVFTYGGVQRSQGRISSEIGEEALRKLPKFQGQEEFRDLTY